MESGRPAPWGDKENCEARRNGAHHRHMQIAAMFVDHAVEDSRGSERCELGIRG